MSIINTFGDVGIQVFWRGPTQLVTKLYSKGIIRILHDWGSDDGAEKIYKIAIWGFKLLGDDFKAAGSDFKLALDVVYGTMVFKSIGKHFIDEEKYRFKLPEPTLITSSLLLSIGSVCQFVYFLMNDVQVISAPVFGQVSNRLGQYKVFQYQPLGLLINKPKDFFVLFGSVAMTIEIFVKNYLNYRNQASRHGVQDVFSLENLLKHTSNIGKVTLILLGRSHGTQPWFIVVAGVTNVASLLSTAIK